MGLGGHLMWTPLAREIIKRVPGSRVIPVEGQGSYARPVNSEVFWNNPNFTSGDHKGTTIPIFLSDPRTNYCIYDAPDHCVQRHDKHVIRQICGAYGFDDVDLRCELYLTDAEREFGRRFWGEIVIDPHTKDQYTVNKRYPFEKWQRVVDGLKKSGITKIVQVGQQTDQVLAGVYDMTGKTTFREAAAIIEQADLFIGPEGGLMHAANAVGTKSVIIITGFLHPTMTCYPENKNIWIGEKHGPCGMKILCEKCQEECAKHDETEIIEATKSLRG